MGRDKVVNHHNEVPFRVLGRKWKFPGGTRGSASLPDENMVIHGDNLVALKALLPRYEGRVNHASPPRTGRSGICRRRWTVFSFFLNTPLRGLAQYDTIYAVSYLLGW